MREKKLKHGKTKTIPKYRIDSMTTEPRYEVMLLDGEQRYGPYDTWDEAAAKVAELGWGAWKNKHEFEITTNGVVIKVVRDDQPK